MGPQITVYPRWVHLNAVLILTPLPKVEQALISKHSASPFFDLFPLKVDLSSITQVTWHFISFTKSISLVLDSPNSVLTHPVSVMFPRTVVIFVSFQYLNPRSSIFPHRSLWINPRITKALIQSPSPLTTIIHRSRLSNYLTPCVPQAIIDLIWCLGLISLVGSRSGSPPLLSWTQTT